MGRWVTSKGRRIYIPDEGEENPFAKDKAKDFSQHSEIQRIADEHVKKIWTQKGGVATKELYDEADKFAAKNNFDKKKIRDAAFKAMSEKHNESVKLKEEGKDPLQAVKEREAKRKSDKLKDQINKEADEKEKQIAKNKEERDKLSEKEKSSRGKGLSTAGQAIADRQSELKAQLKSLDKQRFNKQARPVIEELEARLKAYTRYQNAHYSSSDNEKYYKDLVAREKQITKTDAFNPEAKSTLRKLRAEIEEWKKIKRNVEHDD